ncbi:PadR family transcriptional regulator [Actinoplanes sp. NPDC023801]|uniref:PadR family transcriptional regulator n=1 Tax=Actinoplanes sp. NPDC023801 TaxID=3154595 RepID=UPI00340B7F07
MTLQVRLVLSALADEPDRQLYGLEIIETTGLLPGTIYPILARLEAAGWVVSEWEVVDEREAGRPRRRYYRLTADGLTVAEASAVARGARPRPARGRVIPREAF